MIDDALTVLVVLTIIGSLFALAALLEDRVELRFIDRLLGGGSVSWNPTDEEQRR